jgi:hypothetical protein
METANSSEDVINDAVWMNRRRGSVCNSEKYYFAAFKDPRGMTWYIEPKSDKCCKPDDVIGIHSIPDEDVVVGGELTRKVLNIFFLKTEQEQFYEILVNAFGRKQPHAPDLPLFVDAEVRLASRGLGVGTVRDVIKRSTKGFQSFD